MPPDPSRFERLALQHMGAAYNLAFWLVRSRNDAEDVVQEAFLRAFRAFDGFRGDDIKPWLLAIVRNTAYRWLAARRRSANVVSIDAALFADAEDDPPALQVASDAPNPEDLLLRAGERDGIDAAIAGLPPVFREVIVLREIDGLSYREIAEVTGAAIGTVMSRLSRARAELRKVLGGTLARGSSDAV
jgi:RNA polymerase sigma-70 factor, ECF subfamily